MDREDIEKMAEEALGSRDKAHKWLVSANIALGGARPVDLLDRGEEATVITLLHRLEQGILG